MDPDFISVSPVDVNSPFPRRLWAIVTKNPDGAVRWSGDGKTVIIDLDRFTNYASTNYIGLVASINIKSFKRQLSKYGFRVMSNADTRHGRCSVVYHPYFQRGRPDLVHCIQRVDKPHNTHNELNDGSYKPTQLPGSLADPHKVCTSKQMDSNYDDDSGSESKFPKIKLNNIARKRPKGRSSFNTGKAKISRPTKVRENRSSSTSNGSPGEANDSRHCCCSRCSKHCSSSCHNSEHGQPKTQTVLLPFLLTPQGYIPLAPAQAPVGLPTDNVSIGSLNCMQLLNPAEGNLANGSVFTNLTSAPRDSKAATLNKAAVSSSAIKYESALLGDTRPDDTDDDQEADLWPLRTSASSESLADQDQMLANASTVTWQKPVQSK